MSKEVVDEALKELQAYAGQRLPTVDGFVAQSDRSPDHFERAFCQLAIDLLPAPSDATTVRVTARITAWHDDIDPSKSGYRILPSNGRLELDLLDRLSDKFKTQLPASVQIPDVQAPKPNIEYSIRSPRIPLPPYRTASVASAPPAISSSILAGDDRTDAIRAEREANEKHVQDLNAELRNLQDLQKNQGQPRNLAIVKKAGTPVMARPEQGSRTLFTAEVHDEFEFLSASGEWVHVSIAGASRGYIRRRDLELPDSIESGPTTPLPKNAREPRGAFRVKREETSIFPGDWEPLRGKSVKIYTVEPSSQTPTESAARAKLDFALSLFRKFSADSGRGPLPVEGAVVIFDSADGGIVGSTLLSARQMAAGSLSASDFWATCFVDLPGAIQLQPKN
jgi:hypothetical protein